MITSAEHAALARIIPHHLHNVAHLRRVPPVHKQVFVVARSNAPLSDALEHLGRLEAERRLVELPVLDDPPLRHVRLKEDGLQQPAQRGRRNAAPRGIASAALAYSSATVDGIPMP